MKTYNLLLCILIIFGLYTMKFNWVEMPHDLNEIKVMMKEEIVGFESILGASSLEAMRNDSREAYLSYDYKNKNNLSVNEVRESFINFGWKPKMKKSIYGEYEVFCKNYIHGGFEKKDDNKVNIYLFYSNTTLCFEEETNIAKSQGSI